MEFNNITDEPMMLPGVLDDDIQITSEHITNLDSEVTIDDSSFNTSNSLALTLVPDYKLLSIKNLFTHSVNITAKVLFSTFILEVVKFFI